MAELINEKGFVNLLKNELYALIDEEMAKNMEMDCDLVDELVNAIEALENCENENLTVVLPLILSDGSILSKRIRRKVNGRKAFMRITAVAAAFAVFISGANQIPGKDGKSVLGYAVDELIENVGKIFGIESLTENEDTNMPEKEEENETEEAEKEETTSLPEEEIIEQNKKEPIKASERTMMSIELITDEHFKTSYLWQEKLDLSGLKVIAVYSDNSQEEIQLSECEISGFNSLKIGEQTVTVKYNGFTASFKVIVSRTEQNNEETRTITNVECNVTDTLIRTIGTECPITGKKWRYVYSDGTFSPYYNYNKNEVKLISEYDSQLIDTPQTLTYQVPNGMTFTVTVILYDNTVENEKTVRTLKIDSAPQGMYLYSGSFTDYFAYVGEPVDFSQFKIKITYTDDTSEIVTLGESKIQTFGTMTTDRPSPYGGYKIVFAYGDYRGTLTYDVIIRTELLSYRIDERIWFTYHISEAPAEFTYKKLVIGTLSDTTKEVYLDVEYRGYDPTKTGPIVLQAYYQGEYLCDVLAGYIYDDNNYAIVERPQTEFYSIDDSFEFIPSVKVAYYYDRDHYRTLGDVVDIYGDIVNDNDAYLAYDKHLCAEGIWGLNFRVHSQAMMYYSLKAYNPEKQGAMTGEWYSPYEESLVITEFGEYTVNFKLYNVVENENGTPIRTGINTEFSLDITVKEKPVSYEVEAPDDIFINIQDIYTEFYDKLKVYAIYEDGRREEIKDYRADRYLPSHNIQSDLLYISVYLPDDSKKTFKVYAYTDGYENSWYIKTKKNNQTYKPNTDISKTNNAIWLVSAKGDEYSVSIKELQTDEYTVEGWDTTVPGTYTATVTLHHEILGDLKTTFNYTVDYYTPKMEVVFDSYYDPRYEYTNENFKVIYTDSMNQTYEITDYEYYIKQDWSIATWNLYIEHSDPYNIYIDPSTKEEKIWIFKLPLTPACNGITAERNPSGKIVLSILNDIPDDENIKYVVQYQFYSENKQLGYRDTTSHSKTITTYKSDTAVSVSAYISAYLIDEDGKEYCIFYRKSYSAKIV